MSSDWTNLSESSLADAPDTRGEFVDKTWARGISFASGWKALYAGQGSASVSSFDRFDDGIHLAEQAELLKR